MSPSETDTTRAPLTGTVADVCHDLVASRSEYGDEERLADLVEARCAALGVRHERIRHCVIARTGGDGDPVALVGHLDTVPNWPGGGVHRTAERIVGRGAADMKGGVAVMLRLLERFAARPEPLVHVFYDREEGANRDNGIHLVLGQSSLLGSPTLGIVLEPTGGTVHAGAVGTMNADVVYGGRAAHSARPWEGENAIDNAAAALVRFAARTPEPVEVDGLTYHDVVTVTHVDAGVARNVVPDRCTLWVNVRVAPGRSLDDARREVEQLAGPEGEVRWLDESPSALPSLGAPIVQHFIAETGAPVLPKQAWTDVATLIHAGIPAVNFGPGESSQAHQPEEWVSIETMEQVEDRLARFLEAGAA
jgi:succinyl-diaminopimelate desuccinylase